MEKVIPAFRRICNEAGPNFTWTHTHFENLLLSREVLRPEAVIQALQIYRNDKPITASK